MNDYDDAALLASLLSRSRYDAGKSQEYMALSLAVSKNTISNWERGTSAPNIRQALKWFRVLGLNPFPYMLTYVYPDTFSISDNSSDKELREALHLFIDSMPSMVLRQISYILFANHGSSTFGIIQMVTAHLHTNMRSRVAVAREIYDNYRIEDERSELVLPDQVRPDLDLLQESIFQGRTAAVKGNTGYSSNKK